MNNKLIYLLVFEIIVLSLCMSGCSSIRDNNSVMLPESGNIEVLDEPSSELLDIGGSVIDCSAKTLVLHPDSFNVEQLILFRDHLKKLDTLSFPLTNLSYDELYKIVETYNGVEVNYTVRIGNEVHNKNDSTVDISDLSENEAIKAADRLSLLPNLQYIDLTGNNAVSPYAIDVLYAVFNSCPDAEINYTVDFYSKPISTANERIELKNLNLGEDGASKLTEFLQYANNLKYLQVDNCGISNATMAAIRDQFPNVKVVWRIYIGALSFMTDVKVIHLANEIGDKYISDANSSNLNYCTDIEYLDLGHNVLTNIDFCAYMPHLKYLIMSYNYISDLTPLQNCKELEMAEFYFCIMLSDISPLTECKKLRLLNVSATAVRDISPVYEMSNLERFYCIMNYILPETQMDEILDYLPECWTTFEQKISINVGWSYDEPGKRAEWYLHIYDVWRYNVEPWYMGEI